MPIYGVLARFFTIQHRNITQKSKNTSRSECPTLKGNLFTSMIPFCAKDEKITVRLFCIFDVQLLFRNSFK
jgi:hypothetical protein